MAANVAANVGAVVEADVEANVEAVVGSVDALFVVFSRDPAPDTARGGTDLAPDTLENI